MPVYDLAAAAGGFSEDEPIVLEPGEEGEVRVVAELLGVVAG